MTRRVASVEESRFIGDKMALELSTTTDSSGLVTVGLYSVSTPYPQQHNHFGLQVPPHTVLIGGGATAKWQTSGALLTASYPDPQLTTWFASSKDHRIAEPHILEVYALGLSIQGLTRDQLLSFITVVQSQSSVQQHPTTTVQLPDNYVLLGGGFKVRWSGSGNLATASYPTSSQAWKASSKDHEIADPAIIDSYAIGIRRDLPVGTVVPETLRVESAVAPHPTAEASLSHGYVLTGGGAESRWQGAGNLLWSLKPSGQKFTGASKDHDISDPCSLAVYALGIKIQK